jgi:hypothetical protein
VSLIRTDDFERVANPIGGSFVSIQQTVECDGHNAQALGASTVNDSAARHTDNPTGGHTSKATIAVVSTSNFVSADVCAQSGTGGTRNAYSYYTDGRNGLSSTQVAKIINGAEVVAVNRDPAVAFTAGDIIEIEVLFDTPSAGQNTLRARKNGVQVGADVVDNGTTFGGVGGSGAILTGGSYGLSFFGTGEASFWEGDDPNGISSQVEINTNRARGGYPRSRAQIRRDTGGGFFAGQIYPVPPIVQPATPPASRFFSFAKRRRRGRGGSTTQLAALLAAFSVASTKPIVVAGRKRRKRAGDTIFIRRFGSIVVTASVPKKQPSIVKPKQHRRKRGGINIVTGARRAPFRLTAPIGIFATKRRNKLRPISLIKGRINIVAAPVGRRRQPVIVAGRRRRAGHQGFVINLAGALAFTISTRPTDHIVLVQAKKRHSRKSKITITSGARRVVATISAIRPRNPQTSVLPKKRHRRGGSVTLLAAIVSSSARRQKAPVLIQPDKRRKRQVEVTVVTGARRFVAAVNAIRPRNPQIFVKPGKRVRRQVAITLITGALFFTASVRPTKIVTTVKPKKRHKSTTHITLISGARRSIVLAIKPRKPVVQKAPKRKTRRGLVLLRKAKYSVQPAARRPGKPRTTVYGRLKRRIVRLHGRYGIQAVKALIFQTDSTVHVLRNVLDLSQPIEVHVLDISPVIYDLSNTPFIYSVVPDAVIKQFLP